MAHVWRAPDDGTSRPPPAYVSYVGVSIANSRSIAAPAYFCGSILTTTVASSAFATRSSSVSDGLDTYGTLGTC
ncbi:MAG: hypothetical protein ACYDEB_11640 [Dehalococcoidia bacterium]